MKSLSLIVSNFAARRLHALAALAVIVIALAGSQRSTAAGELELFHTDRMILAWNDGGSGGDNDGSFWVPDVPAGYKPLGQVAVAGYGQPAGMTVVKLAGAGTALAYPVDFVEFWYDGGSGASMSTQFWKPVPPPGYVSLGTVCSINTYDKPALDSVVCVRSDLVVAGTVGDKIWDDSGSGGDQDGSSWDIVAPAGAIDINAFQGQRSHSYPSETVYCLKATVAAPPAAPSDAQVASMISNYGPVFKFHPEEPWMPDDPAVVLNDPGTRLKWMTVQNENSNPGFAQTDLGSSTTSSGTIVGDVQQALSHPMANDPSFRYLLDYPYSLAGGSLSRTKAWVRVQPHNQNTELQFWIFYPYNGPGKARMTVGDIFTEYFDPTGTMGIHYSDWECVRVRLTNRNVWDPGTYKFSSVVLSRHSTDEEIFAGDPRLTYYLGSPIVYVGKGSHAQYPTADTHYYDRPKSLDFGVGTFAIDLYDLTGNGQSFNAYSSSNYVIVSSAWPGITTAPPDWLFFCGTWGKYLLNEFSVTIDYGFSTHTENQREVGNGKPGLLNRGEWGVNFPQNANLGLLRTSAGTISPAFNPNVTGYTMKAGAGVSQLTLLAQASEDNALVEARANGGAWAALPAGQLLGRQSNPLGLIPGSNTVEIRVTNPPPSAPVPGVTAAVKIYTLTVTKPAIPIDWYGQSDTTHDSVDAAESGNIADSQSSSMETSVTGEGVISFWWKVSSEGGWDYLRFYVDGVEQPGAVGISGEVDWQQVTVPVSGVCLHTLRWTYSKDDSVSSPADAGWVDEVVFTIPLPVAVDAPSLAIATTGDGLWFGQALVTHDGMDAAQSGDVAGNQSSTMTTTVNVPSTLSFWWKVSSEGGWDYLRFYVDGVEQPGAAEISGEVDWQLKTVPIPAGIHTLSWVYSKDSQLDEGADAAWVDQVTITPLTGYALWAALNVPPGKDASFNGISLPSGVQNGFAYVFGPSPVVPVGNQPAGSGKILAPPSIPSDVDVYLDWSSPDIGIPLQDWGAIVSWVNGQPPVFAFPDKLTSIVDGYVIDTGSAIPFFYRYRIVQR